MRDIVKLHKLIDDWDAEERKKEEAENTDTAKAADPGSNVSPTGTDTAPNAPAEPTHNDKNQRVVRTKTSGDRVYMLDEANKTRQWVTSPEILDALGFTLNMVSEIPEPEFLKYTMGPAIYKLPDGNS